uniref:Transmembrane protein 53 n=1 Tax=Anser brachyrhynchus TaxID=132585 RepID=A0A8B9CLY9_9AVES
PRAGQRRGDVELPLDPCTARTHGGAEAGRQPVVILLGWAGCQDRYLAKYSAIYSQRVFCMVSCLLLSPLLVEGISVGGKTDELVTEHLITEMKQSQRVTVSEAEDPTESVSCHFLEREKTNTTHLCLAGRPPSGQHNSKIWG